MAYNILLGLFTLLSFLEIINKKRKKIILLILAGIIYWIFFGFRGYVAYDWYNYHEAYINNNFHFEIGYNFFINIGKYLFDNYFNFIAFSTLLDTIILTYFFYKYSPYPIMSFCMFFAFYGITIQFDLLRHMRAFMIFLISLSSVLKNKKFEYMFYNFLGVSFHRISILYLPLYFILRKNLWKLKKYIILLLIIGLLLISLKINLVRMFFLLFKGVEFYGIGGKIESYILGVHGNIQMSTIGNIERAFTFFVFYYYSKKIQNNKFGILFFNIYILFIIGYVYFYSFKIISDRLVNYTFIVSYWILWPTIIYINNRKKKIYIYFFLIIIMFLKVNMIHNWKGKKLYFYKNVLFQKENFEERKRIRKEEKKIEYKRMRKFIENYNKE